MSDSNDQDTAGKGRLSLRPTGRLENNTPEPAPGAG